MLTYTPSRCNIIVEGQQNQHTGGQENEKKLHKDIYDGQ